MNYIYRKLVLILLLGLTSLPLTARDLFEVSAFTTDTPPDNPQPITVNAGDSDFIKLIQATVEGTNQFEILVGRDSTSILNYGGFNNAMRFDINAAGTLAILDIPVIRFQRTFTAANRNDLYEQIKRFLKNEGEDVYRRFLEAMNKKSPVAVSDGNPNATTANVANAIFEDAGFGGEEAVSQALDLENLNLSLAVGFGQFSTKNLNGNKTTLPLGYNYRWNEWVDTKIKMPLTYWQVEGTEIYDGSFIVSVPVKVMVPVRVTDSEAVDSMASSRFGWTLTPTLGIAAGGSRDYRAGSVMYVGALTSLLTYDFGRVNLALGNHLSAMKAISNHVGDLDVGSDIDQQITKNGLKLTVPFNGQWVGEVYGIYTAFLQDAAVDDFFTLGLRAGTRWLGGGFGENGVIMFGIYGDVGNDYRSLNVRFGSAFRF
jgi:hypothetical protein